jgi:type VI secretion system secreted protein Hcp
MALMAYMTIKGSKSGAISGPVTTKGREGSISLLAFSQEITSPRDPQSGLPTGQRLHKPVVITKEIDKTSPLLYNVLCTNENLTDVTIKFWQPQLKAVSGSGTEAQHYTVKLSNANISSMDVTTQEFSHDEKVSTAKVVEKLSFTYEKIEWTWNDGGITANDTWGTHVS